MRENLIYWYRRTTGELVEFRLYGHTLTVYIDDDEKPCGLPLRGNKQLEARARELAKQYEAMDNARPAV